jgi:hypothetical protein
VGRAPCRTRLVNLYGANWLVSLVHFCGTLTLIRNYGLALYVVLTANWKRRTQLVNYCAEVVDQSISEGRIELEMQQRDSAAVQKKTRGRIYENEVKVRPSMVFNTEPTLTKTILISASKFTAN